MAVSAVPAFRRRAMFKSTLKDTGSDKLIQVSSITWVHRAMEELAFVVLL